MFMGTLWAHLLLTLSLAPPTGPTIDVLFNLLVRPDVQLSLLTGYYVRGRDSCWEM